MPGQLVLVRRLFTGASVAWAVLLPCAAFVASSPQPSVWLWSFAVAMYGIGAVICHQLPARTFHLWSAQLPVCARCTGIYLGAALGAVAAQGRSAPVGIRARPALIGSALPTLATLAFEWTTGITPANWIRALAGLPLGAAVAWVVIRVN
jgi:uncharacterized membrane protein